ncbi:MAG TPA: S8 family serine peptidase, partial [Actinopolymorphaceae bacterium]
IAARAAGTNLGRDVSESYTSMGGTSMAAPHVAGAAAILAERHPDWTAQQLKAALAASATPRSGTPTSAQGTGLIDVESALRLPVVPDRATVSFGDLTWSDGPPESVSRDVTYTNVSQRAVTLRLSADVRTPNRVRPDLTVTPSTLRIAPGETAKATVRLDLADTEGGSYSGILTARGAGATVRTGIGFASGGKLHEVTVSGIDRSGNPARPVSGVQLWNTETGDVDAIAFDDNGQRTLHVPTGKYALMVFIMTPDEGGWDQSVALLGKPELTIDRSMTLKFDARDTVPMTIRTPKDSEIDSYIYAWHRKVGDRTALSGWSKDGATEELYVQPFSRVRSGTFDVAIRWDLAQPVLTLHTTGPDGFRVGNPDPRGFAERYEGTEDIPLVDGGDGSVEELERAGAADKIALVRVRFDGGMPDGLTEQLRAAERVGVKVLLLYRDEPGWWSAGEETSVPVYLLEKPEAQPLLDRLADGPVTVRTHGVAQPTYRYDLVFTEDAVREPVRYDVDARSLAAVTTTYKKHDPGRELSHRESRSAYLDGVDIGFPSTRPVFAPLTRTDYVNTRTAEGPVTWGEDAYADLWNWAGREYSLPRRYRSGQRVDQEWWPAISRPAVLDAEGNEEDGIPVARFDDAIRAAIPQFVSGDGDIYGWGQSYDRTTMTLRRNGKSLGQFDWSVGQWPVPPAPADYELDLTVERSDRAWAATSTRTHTVWSFRSGHVSGRAVLPLLQAEYRLDSDTSNHVASGGPVRLSLVPDYQPGARGPGRIRTTVEVSYDGGATWTAAPVEARPRGVVDVRVPAAPAGAEAADLRVTLKDRAGNAMVQTIDKAWLLK